jgi:ABC-type Fe3+/spermidine/putrescine transport system ATPase subunit
VTAALRADPSAAQPSPSDPAPLDSAPEEPAATMVEREAAVQLIGATKRFGQTLAVNSLDLEVPRGQFLALLGPSGCGKTTTLRMIGGFEIADQGRILINGEDVTRRPPDRRPVNTVFQSYALFPHMTVLDNVSYGLRLRGTPKSEANGKAAEMLALVGLHDVGGRRPRQLSGGMQQRVALARALILRPAVLLLDEPLGSLDLKFRKQMQFELRRIHREVGGTFIHVTHDQEEAMTMADRICVMAGGRIVQSGTPTEIYDEPNSRYVAGFIGSSSFIEGTVRTIAGSEAVLLVDGVGELRGHATAGLKPGDRAVLALRPEQVFVGAAVPGPREESRADCSVWGRLVDLTPTGAASLARMSIGGKEIVAQVPRSFAGTLGDEYLLSWETRTARAYRADDSATASAGSAGSAGTAESAESAGGAT